MDLNPLFPVPKIIPPEEEQLSNESRRFWHDVTHSILAREYSKATTLKQQLEEQQRQRAAARKENGGEYLPRFFTGVVTPVGQPVLTKDGEEALTGLEEGNFRLQPSTDRGT